MSEGPKLPTLNQVSSSQMEELRAAMLRCRAFRAQARRYHELIIKWQTLHQGIDTLEQQLVVVRAEERRAWLAVKDAKAKLPKAAREALL
jgi:hypothetical protein